MHRSEDPLVLARMAWHLHRDDPRLARALSRHRRAAPATRIAAVAAATGSICFLVALSLPSTPLFVLGLATLLAGWATLAVRCPR